MTDLREGRQPAESIAMRKIRIRVRVAAAAAPTAERAHAVGMDASAYLYSLVTMDLTRRQLTNVPAGAQGRR